MTDAAVPFEETAVATRGAASNRWGAAVLALFTLFTLNFGAYRVFGDGINYYSFTQRLFGDRSGGSGYNFGVGLLNARFYAWPNSPRSSLGTSRRRSARRSRSPRSSPARPGRF